MISGHQPQRIATTHAPPASASWPQVATRIRPQIATPCPASASWPEVVTRIQPQIPAACLAIASWPQMVTRILSQIAAACPASASWPQVVTTRPQVAAAHARPVSASQPQVVTIYKEVSTLTDVDILKAGLPYAGFDTSRQVKVNLNQNMMRCKHFYGVHPSTTAPLFRDLRNKFPSFKYKDKLMTINWLFLNNTQSVLSGRWGYCEEYIGPTIKENATMIQSLKSKKIKFVLEHDKRIKGSIDCTNFTTNEFRQDPSGKWYEHKATPVAWYVFVCSVANALFFPPFHSNHCAA
jgi:hypothetical protein